MTSFRDVTVLCLGAFDGVGNSRGDGCVVESVLIHEFSHYSPKLGATEPQAQAVQQMLMGPCSHSRRF